MECVEEGVLREIRPSIKVFGNPAILIGIVEGV